MLPHAVLSSALLTLASCSTTDHRVAFDGYEDTHREPTLADLPRVDISLEEEALDALSVHQVLEGYEQALELFSTPQQRVAILRRMADLSMIASEEAFIAALDATEDPSVDPLSDDADAVDVDYAAAIAMYESLLENAGQDALDDPTTDLAEIYYLLAKAYDLSGETAASMETLGRLLIDYPGSRFHAEAQFRRAEYFFRQGEYQEATLAYLDVISRDEDSAFLEPSLYKRGWSRYKQGDYDLALEDFFALIDRYQPDAGFWESVQREEAELAAAEAAAANADSATDDSTGDDVSTDTDSTPAESIASADETAADDETTVQDSTTDVAASEPSQDPPPGNVDAEPVKKREISGSERKMLADTFRVAAMAFANLDGTRSLDTFFREHGPRDYEVDVYHALAALYLYQERYRDAADTFDAFTQARPLHPFSPKMSSRVIDTYIQGGFPSLVLPQKERFVTQYGVYSDYWKQASPAARELYAAELKQHLVELAQHYHALAQAGKADADYKQAERWYREYITTFPKDPATPQMSLLLAEILYTTKQFAAAIEQFERAAYYFEGHSEQERAAYFSLLAYQEHINTLAQDDPTRRGWIAKRTGAALRFAKAYPANEQTPTILDSVIEDQLALNDLPGAISTAQMIIRWAPPAPRPIWEKALMTQANGLFDMGRFQEAEQAIEKVLELTSLTQAQRKQFNENRAVAIYRQAEHLQRNGQLRDAALAFLRVGATVPDAPVRANADYDAATLFMETESWEQAIQVLETFRTRFPDHELAKTVPLKLSIAYEKTQRWTAAAGELEAIAQANMDTDKPLAQEALWQAAQYQDKANQPADAIRLYRDYVWAFEEPYTQRVDAINRLASLYEQTNEPSKRLFWLNKQVEWFLQRGSNNNERSQQLAATAAFTLAEPAFNQFKSIRLTQPLRASLQRKRRAMQEATAAYTRTVEVGLLEYSTASTHRIGEIYQLMARAILDSDRPRGLDELALEEYELLLEDQALPFEDRAIEILQRNAERTRDGTWNEWIAQSFKSLAKLLPARFGKQERGEEVVDEIF